MPAIRIFAVQPGGARLVPLWAWLLFTVCARRIFCQLVAIFYFWHYRRVSICFGVDAMNCLPEVRHNASGMRLTNAGHPARDPPTEKAS